MPYVVCAEEVEDRWVAHVPDLPGGFASDKERDEAINAVPAAIQEYVAWCSGHGLHVSGISGPMVVDEVIRSWMYEDDYEVNAFFAADRPPILPDEVAEIQLLLSATRSDLSSAVADLDEEALLKEFAGERWPVFLKPPSNGFAPSAITCSPRCPSCPDASASSLWAGRPGRPAR